MKFVHVRDQAPVAQARWCRAFFSEIYTQAFPHPDQVETVATWLPLLGHSVPPGQPLLSVILALDTGGRLLGGILFEQYRGTGCWLASYLAVCPAARRQGVGTALLRQAVQQIAHTAEGSWMLFAEAENPACLVDPAQAAQATARLDSFAHMGLEPLPIAYVQPALCAGRHALDDLLLLCYTPHTVNVASAVLLGFLRAYYGALGQADAPWLDTIGGQLGDRVLTFTNS
jgi:GNAT superfamily N-acetyltransferase